MAVAFTFKNSATGTSAAPSTTVTTSGASFILVSVHWGSATATRVTALTVGGNAARRYSRKEASQAGVEIWAYWSTGSLSSASVSATLNASADWGIAVSEATGTDANSVGASGDNTGTSTTETVNTPVTVNDARPFAGFTNFGSAGTVVGSTVELADFTNGTGDFFQQCYFNNTTTAGSTYGISETITSAAYAAASVEIRPSGSGVTFPTISEIGSWAETTTATLSPAMPAHVAGDLLIVEAHSSTNGTTVPTQSTPSGWSVIGTISNDTGTRRGLVTVFAKKAASSSETFSSTVSPSTGTNNRLHRGRGLAIKGWNDTGTLADAREDPTTAIAADSSTLAFSGFATTATYRLALLSAGQCDDTAATAPVDNAYRIITTYAGSDWFDSATGSDGFSMSAFKQLATSGSSTPTVTFTTGGSVSTFGVLFGLVPASATTTHDMAGAPSLTVGAAGSPTRDAQLSGSAALSFGASGSPSKLWDLSGSPALALGAAGDPSVTTGGNTHDISGVAALSFGLAGDPSFSWDLSGAPALSFGAAGSPTRDAMLSGAAVLSFGAAGAPSKLWDLSGAPSLSLGLAGDPTRDAQLSGAPGLSLGLAGSPTHDAMLSGAPGLVLGAAGQLTGPPGPPGPDLPYNPALGTLPHPWWTRIDSAWRRV